MASDPLGDVARAMRSAADELPRDMRTNLARAAKTIPDDIAASLRQGLPNRGGLARRAAAQRITVTDKSAGDGVALRIESNGDIDLSVIDDGQVAHPTFGRGRFVTQRVKSGLVSGPVKANQQRLEDAAAAAVNDAVTKIERA